MVKIINPTGEALLVQGVGRIEAGEAAEVSDEVAETFVGHPVLEVDGLAAPAQRVDEQPPEGQSAAVPPEQVTVSVPPGEHVEIVPDAPAANGGSAQ